MSRALWTRLAIPLVVAFCLALCIHQYWEAGGFFLNLASGILCILITVCYVDWILRQHRRQTWQDADARIKNRLRILLNAVVSSVRSGLGYPPEIVDEAVRGTLDQVAIHKEVIRVGTHIIAPSIHERIQLLDAKGWQRLARQVYHIHNGTLVFLNAFQFRLTPEQTCHLLDIEDGLSSSLTFYSIIPELMGVPVDQLPETKSPPEELQRFGCESAATQLSRVLLIAEQLSRTIDDNPD